MPKTLVFSGKTGCLGVTVAVDSLICCFALTKVEEIIQNQHICVILLVLSGIKPTIKRENDHYKPNHLNLSKIVAEYSIIWVKTLKKDCLIGLRAS